MSLSENNLHPQNVQASYPGCANPTTSSTDEPPAAYSEPNAKALGKAPLGSEQESAGIDSAKVIEGAEIAPLGEGKIADDPSTTTSGGDAPGLVDQATDMAKQAYTAVVGESK